MLSLGKEGILLSEKRPCLEVEVPGQDMEISQK